MDACVHLILMVIFQERRTTFTWLILKGATGSGWLWFLPYQNPENPRQLHITALILCWKPNLGTVSLGPWAILLQKCDLDSARSFAAKGFSLVPLWTNQKIPEIRGLRTRIRGSFWIACFNLQKRMNSSIQGSGLLAKVGKVGKAVPLKADSKCKGVAPKLGTCDGTPNLLQEERTLTRCLGPHATVQFFLISKQKPVLFWSWQWWLWVGWVGMLRIHSQRGKGRGDFLRT